MAVGAVFAIAACNRLVGVCSHQQDLPIVIAPLGASAVLGFYGARTDMAGLWPMIAGPVLSATAGVAAARLLADPLFAVPLAVAGALLAMRVARCFHPPSAAVALSAVVGGHAIADEGLRFILFPVGLDWTLLAVMVAALRRAR